MSDEPLSTRDRLVATAARLFRRHGYHGTGTAEILLAAKAPKGSLYHHFPAGKSELALAAADWAGALMLRSIKAAFDPAPTHAAGVTALCEALASDLALSAGRDGSPVTPILDDDSEAFRARAVEIFGRWRRALAYHAIRLGADEDRAEAEAAALLIAIEGAFALARAQGRPELLRLVGRRAW